MTFLIIGYGNTLCGDDGIGPYAVEELEESIALLTGVECLTCHQLTPELAEAISQVDTVIFVDAVVNDGAAGEIACQRVELIESPALTAPGAFTHHVSVAALLANAQSLYGKHPQAWLYTVSGKNFGLGDPMSAAVEDAMRELIELLKIRISENRYSIPVKSSSRP